MDPSYSKPAANYGAFLLAASIIASIYCGPGTLVVWLVTVVVMVIMGRCLFSDKDPPTGHRSTSANDEESEFRHQPLVAP